MKLVAFYFNSNFSLGMRQILEPLENNHRTFYGPDGGHATISTDSSGNVTIIIVDPDGTKNVYTRGTTSNTIYVAQNGASAEIFDDRIVVTHSDGTTTVYKMDANGYDDRTNYDNYNHYSGEFENVTFTDGTKIYYYSGNTYENPNNINNYDRYEPYGGSTATQYTGPAGNTATTYTGPAGNSATTFQSDQYYNSLPEGINRWQIPKGEEDKYILKSQVVPPVCPKCPDVQCNNSSFDESKCRPCPACERCPESNFTCEKIPNYSAFNSKTMPLPVLSDFSNFGM